MTAKCCYDWIVIGVALLVSVTVAVYSSDCECDDSNPNPVVVVMGRKPQKSVEITVNTSQPTVS